MGYSVKEKAEYVGTFRWIEIQLMEMLAGWVPSTPEMEVKILFGRHVWDCAQHADHLGKRAFELRAPLHFTLPAVPECRALLAEFTALTATPDRVGAFYEILLPLMIRQYRGYVAGTGTLLDEPTVRILELAMLDYERMSRECDRLAGNGIRRTLDALPRDWRARSEALATPVAHSSDEHHARGVPA